MQTTRRLALTGSLQNRHYFFSILPVSAKARTKHPQPVARDLCSALASCFVVAFALSCKMQKTHCYRYLKVWPFIELKTVTLSSGTVYYTYALQVF